MLCTCYHCKTQTLNKPLHALPSSAWTSLLRPPSYSQPTQQTSLCLPLTRPAFSISIKQWLMFTAATLHPPFHSFCIIPTCPPITSTATTYPPSQVHLHRAVADVHCCYTAIHMQRPTLTPQRCSNELFRARTRDLQCRGIACCIDPVQGNTASVNSKGVDCPSKLCGTVVCECRVVQEHLCAPQPQVDCPTSAAGTAASTAGHGRTGGLHSVQAR